MIRLKALPAMMLVACAVEALGEEEPRVTLENVEPPPAISPDEPLREEFSPTLAARYLDSAALHWQKQRKCGTCHTNFAYLMARPALKSVSPPSLEVRKFFESMVEKRWEDQGPRWDAEVVVTAALLAANDRLTTGKLSPVTRKAFQRMWKLQREDGGWDWLECGWPPMESDAHYGVTLAALGVGMAPGGYAASEEGKAGVEGIRRYLRKNSPPSLHHRAMLLWASTRLDGLMEKKEQAAVLKALFSLQRPDGGWAMASLLEGWEGHKRKDDSKQELEKSDGYGTGFVTYVARQGGVSAGDARLQKAIGWLKANQRQSGRWFTRSPTRDSKHFISNAGTAFAVMAIDACLP